MGLATDMADEVVSHSAPGRRARRRPGAPPRRRLAPLRPDEGVVPDTVDGLRVIDLSAPNRKSNGAAL
jgi:hypothetical protein